MDSQEININTWQVMKNLSKVWESLLILESTKRAKSWNIEILLDQKIETLSEYKHSYASPSLQSKQGNTSDLG